MSTTIYYDGDCPFCSRYVTLLRLREIDPTTQLVDVRINTEARTALASRGINLDQGMAVEIDGQLHMGADAVHTLAAMTTSSTRLNRLNRWVFASKMRSRFLYPWLRAGRNATLFLLGRQPLTPPAGQDLARFELFNTVWGVFAVLHFLVYAYQFNAPIYVTTWILPPLGVLLLLHPRSVRIFAALFATFVVDAWLQMPAYSNHTILKNFLLLAMLAAGIRVLATGGTTRRWIEEFAPTGRVLLVTMYFFGVFHKINSDFLDPSVSCAVALWQRMPWPLNLINGEWMQYLAIYGTLVIEAAILACLVMRQTRHVGIGVGIAFHSVLALSGYALYAPFSTLTVALHVLFLERENSGAIVGSQPCFLGGWRCFGSCLTTPATARSQ
jgi:predicted DCC family thiol-disulfide oxidoreductase YuxK